jgi:hypothetical protein
MVFSLISSSTASSRLGLVAVMVAGLCLYMQYHLHRLPRANFNGLEYFEDSRNSEWRETSSTECVGWCCLPLAQQLLLHGWCCCTMVSV